MTDIELEKFIKIELDQYRVLPGATVTGNIKIRDNLNLKYFKIDSLGYECTGHMKIGDQPEETFFTASEQVWTRNDQPDPITIPFTFKLPENCSASFKNKDNGIFYSIKLVAGENTEANEKFQPSNFEVAPKLDLRTVKTVYSTISARAEAQFVRNGYMKAEIPRRGYLPGNLMRIDLMTHFPRRQVNYQATVTLQRTTHFLKSNQSFKDEKATSTVQITKKDQPINLGIPGGLMCNFENEDVRVNYQVLVSVAVEQHRVEVELPLILGTEQDERRAAAFLLPNPRPRTATPPREPQPPQVLDEDEDSDEMEEMEQEIRQQIEQAQNHGHFMYHNFWFGGVQVPMENNMRFDDLEVDQYDSRYYPRWILSYKYRMEGNPPDPNPEGSVVLEFDVDAPPGYAAAPAPAPEAQPARRYPELEHWFAPDQFAIIRNAGGVPIERRIATAQRMRNRRVRAPPQEAGPSGDPQIPAGWRRF